MRTVFAVLAGVALAGFARPAAAQVPASRPAEFKVIVNADNPVGILTPEDVSRLFLRKTPTWYNGQAVLPVDQNAHAAARAAFLREIHQKNEQALDAYWRQQVFTGKAVPPLVLGSDTEVIDFVRRNPTAVGYVSAGAALGPEVKVVIINR
jgi:ABC-type phosphate transport system substrate-binding protein